MQSYHDSIVKLAMEVIYIEIRYLDRDWIKKSQRSQSSGWKDRIQEQWYTLQEAHWYKARNCIDTKAFRFCNAELNWLEGFAIQKQRSNAIFSALVCDY